MLRDDRFAHGLHVALEIAAILLADLLQPDDAHARHRRRRPAAIDALAERVAPILAHHGHVVPGSYQLAQQVERIDAHA